MLFYFLRRPKISASILFSIIALAIFGFSLSFGFVLDDESQVVNNQYIHSLGNLLGAFTGSTMDSLGAKRMAGIYYKPVMTISYIVLWAISHEAWIFHFFQLFLHVLNTFLVFSFFCTVGKFSKSSKSLLLYFFLAVGFLVHPINVEAVVYIADLQDVLFSSFGLLALNFMATYQGSHLKTGVYLSALFELSLLSKESGVLYLLITLVFCIFFNRGKFKLCLAAIGAALVVYLGLRVGLAQLTHGSNSSQMLRADLWDRLISMPKIIFHYFVTFFFPANLALVEDWVVKDFTLSEFWFPLLGILGIMGAVVFLLKSTKDPVIFFFLTWFILGMGAHSNLVPLDGTVADRWFYFPIIGLLGMIGFYVHGRYLDDKVFKNKFHKEKYERFRTRNRFVSALFVVLILFGWSARSFARTLDWETALRLYRHDLVLMPDNFYLNNNVGVELFRTGNIQEALVYFKKSTELFPEWSTSWNNLGSANERLGNFADAEKAFRQSVQNGPSALGYQNYANMLLNRGKKAELREFMEKQGLVAFPDNPILKGFYEESLH